MDFALNPVFAQLAVAPDIQTGLAIIEEAAQTDVTVGVADAFLGTIEPSDSELGADLRARTERLRGGLNLIERGHQLAEVHRLFQTRFTDDSWGRVRGTLVRIRELSALGVPNPAQVAALETKMGFQLSLDPTAIATRTAELARLFTEVTLPIPDSFHDLPPNQQQALKILGKAMLLLEAPYRLQMTPHGDQFERLVMETPALAPLRPYYLRWATIFDMTRSELCEGGAHRYYGFLPGMEKVTRPPGGGMYPPDMTADLFAKLVPKDSPLAKEMRVIFQYQNDRLIAVPFSEAYAEWLTPAAKLLEEAAELFENDLPEMADYLRVTANAYRTNDFTAVDIAWVRLKAETLDLNVAPVEQNTDKIRAMIAHFAGFLQIRNKKADAELTALKNAFAELEERLPIPDEYKLPPAKRIPLPVSAVQSLFAVGDGTSGEYPAVAYNQPNNAQVRREVGKRIVLMENLEAARQHTPQAAKLADLAIDPRYRHLVTTRAGEWWVRFHELSHGHGVEFLLRDPETSSRQALEDIYGTLEELKADLTAIHDAKEAVAMGLISQDILNEIYVTYVVWSLNKLRKGEAEDHARGNLVALNFLQDRGAIIIDPETGVIDFNFEKYAQAASEATRTLILFKGDGDKEGANAFFAKYGTKLPLGLKTIFDAMKDWPVDVVFHYAFENELN